MPARRQKRPLEDTLRKYLDDNNAWVERRFGGTSGETLGKFLGCGSWGCAWMFGEEVLKVTTDPSEATNVAMIGRQFSRQELPGVVYTHKLCRGPGHVKDHKTGKTTRVWLYLREYIEPFTHRDEANLRVYSGGKTALEHVQKAGWKWLRAPKGRRAQYVSAYLHGVDILRDELPLVADAMETLWEDQGLLLADVHLGNIGWARRDLRSSSGGPGTKSKRSEDLRDYEVVIFDLGQSSKTASRGVDLVERCDA